MPVDHVPNQTLAPSQQRVDDGLPLGMQRDIRSHGWASGSRIPITGIADIAFLAMKVGVHPIAFRTISLLRQGMRPIPVSLRVCPKGLQG